MKFAYHYKVTGLVDGFSDLVIPVSSWSARLKSGARSTVDVSIPSTDFFSDLAARPNGEIVIELYGDGALIAEVVRLAVLDVIPDYGLESSAVRLSGGQQRTYDRAVEPHDLAGLVFYRAPNRTNGLWTYHLGGPQPHILPMDQVFFGVHAFTVGEITWRHDGGDSTVVYLAEAAVD